MCGFAGVVGIDTIGEQARDVALSSLAHRGPDASGSCVVDDVLLLHTRLSILDLDARSDQPFVGDDGRFMLIYNGELYNFQALRRELEREGQAFRTNGDTEVLLALLTRWGPSGLRRAKGMYSFALLDRQDRTVLLGRDPFGIKPLVWCRVGSSIAFASTIDALLALGVEPRVDPGYISDFLAYGHGVLGSTPIDGVERVPPGGCVLIDGKSVKTWRHHDLREERAQQDDVPARDVFNTIEESIVRHTVADVPVGMFLSGGVDSALVAGVMRKAGQRVVSFSVGFSHAGFDESDAAADAARRIGTEHRSVQFDLTDVPRLFSELIEGFDEPFGDAAALPTLAVSRRAAEEVKVVLSGEGGDEFFGGYRRYLLHRWSTRVPRALRMASVPLLDRRAPRLAGLVGWSRYADGYVRWLEFGLVRNGGSAYAAELDRIRARQGPSNEMWSLMLFDQVGWLVDTYLVKLDRATMRHSLEGRVPLIDLDVAAVARRLRGRDRMTNPRVGKNLLRSYASQFVGERHVNRPKHGFAVPMEAIRGSGVLADELAGVLSRASAAGTWGARLATAARLESQGGGWAAATRWWYLVVLLAWCDRRGALAQLDAIDEHANRDAVLDVLRTA
jgi:asparagine synthase (glutamine-hydrolysing)